MTLSDPVPENSAETTSTPLQVLFVHGMGRSPLSGWPLLWRLKRIGLTTHSFGYVVTINDFSEIVGRLAARMERLAQRGDYVVIGHSLGGVLLRAAIARLPASTSAPSFADWIGDRVELAIAHTLLPSSPRVADVILERVEK